MFRVECGSPASKEIHRKVAAGAAADHTRPRRANSFPEVLIADARRSNTSKEGIADLAVDPHARIKQLEKTGKLYALTRIRLTAVEGQKASIRVSQLVPKITASQRSPTGQSNSFTMENVGLRVSLMPKILLNGLVAMTLDIEQSQLGPEEQGAIISKPSNGDAIRVAPTDTFTAQTTISARNGQSVVVGGLITRQQARQGELLIIVTPELLDNEPAAVGR